MPPAIAKHTAFKLSDLPVRRSVRSAQRGAVLVITLVLMLIASLVGAYMAATVGDDLRMTHNAQEAQSALEAADAGVSAVLMLSSAADTNATDPLRGGDNPNPFDGIDDAAHPLAKIPDGPARMTVGIRRVDENAICPPETPGQASSIRLFRCDYYDIQSRYSGATARAEVSQGVWRIVPQ